MSALLPFSASKILVWNPQNGCLDMHDMARKLGIGTM